MNRDNFKTIHHRASNIDQAPRHQLAPFPRAFGKKIAFSTATLISFLLLKKAQKVYWDFASDYLPLLFDGNIAVIIQYTGNFSSDLLTFRRRASWSRSGDFNAWRASSLLEWLRALHSMRQNLVVNIVYFYRDERIVKLFVTNMVFVIYYYLLLLCCCCAMA